MNTVLLILICLLIAVILYILFRLSVLASVFRGKSNLFRVDPLNSVNAWLFPVFMVVFFIGVVWVINFTEEDSLADAVTVQGEKVDASLDTNLILILIVFFAAHLPLFLFPLFYRHSNRRKALFYPMNLKMEIIWTAIPFLAYMGLFIAGYIAWNDIKAIKAEDPLVIEVTGEQFTWVIRYPGLDRELGRLDPELIDTDNILGLDLSQPATFDDFTTGAMHIPVNRDVVLKIRSRDVIHSVFIPHFRLKMDAVPGFPTSLNLKATKTTSEMRKEKGIPSFNYSIYCAELCGRLHYAMKIDVIVQEPDEFLRWQNRQGSWLARHEEYLSSVPVRYRALAKEIVAKTQPAVTEEDADFFFKTVPDSLKEEAL